MEIVKTRRALVASAIKRFIAKELRIETHKEAFLEHQFVLQIFRIVTSIRLRPETF